MNFNQLTAIKGVIAASSFILLSACATTTATKTPAAPVAAATPDVSQPTSPIGAFVIEAPESEPAKAIPLPARGSVASVVEKMESSPYTLYWKEDASYSYYVGGVLDAEYKPGAGLTVQEAKADDTGITCKFDAEGNLSTATVRVDQKSSEVCSQLMFTLDDELSD